MNNKKILTILAAAGLAVATLGTGSIYAQSENQNGKTIVQRISERFNLNETEVQTVFDEQHEERQEQRQQLMNEKLNTLVSEGKLTEDQKNKLIEKFKEKQDKKEGFRDLTREEMRAKMAQERTAFDTWLTENGIDKDLIHMNMGFGKGGMRGERIFHESE